MRPRSYLKSVPACPHCFKLPFKKGAPLGDLLDLISDADRPEDMDDAEYRLHLMTTHAIRYFDELVWSSGITAEEQDYIMAKIASEFSSKIVLSRQTEILKKRILKK